MSLHRLKEVQYKNTMRLNSVRGGLGALALGLALVWAPAAGAAESLDSPTIIADKPLVGPSTQSGTISARVGFPGHVYTAKKDGFVKVVMKTTNVKPSDNNGVAWRPYMRILSQSNATRNGEAWSSNGYQTGATAEAEIVLRVTAGEKFTVVASLALHTLGAQRVNANYTVTVKE